MAATLSERFATCGFAYGVRIRFPGSYYLQGPHGRLWHFLALGADILQDRQYQAWDRSVGAVICYGR